ncbi:MAG: hypothetical protein ACYDBV_11785 [Nitrospiria bacterium]
MSYIKFGGQGAENDLIQAILSSSQAAAVSKNFPKVSVIGRTRIVPDIDVLQIKEENGSNKLIGFEIKLIKLREEKTQPIGLDWKRIYEGIGEALLYLQFGLDRCGLILGFHKNVPDEQIDQFSNKFEQKSDLLSKIFPPYFCLGIFKYEHGGIFEIIKITNDFSYYGCDDKLYGQKIEERMRTYKNNLLTKEFLWDKKLGRRCTYAEK